MNEDMRDEQGPGPGGFGAIGAAEVVAVVVSLLWAVACVAYFNSAGGPGFLMALAAIVVPIALIGIAASAARAARIARDDGRRIHSGLNQMRHSLVDAQRVQALGGHRPEELTRRIEDINAAEHAPDDARAVFASKRPHDEDHQPAPDARSMRDVSPEARPMRDVSPKAAAPEAAPVADEQPSLAFGGPTDGADMPAEIEDLIRAINFPEDADDEAGFEALRRALADRKVSSLIQAAQDVLTLLSQDGIYMDDLKPDQARPAVWRQFAGGARGRAVAALGGIRDRSSLALSAGRMRSDAKFRDTSLQFLRRFDEVLTEVEPRLSDEQMARFGATRTARAFMLLGRVTGTFD